MNEETILLPQTEAGLDALVSKIVTDYALPDTDDTYDTIATMILHLPQSKAHMPLSYFGEGVQKSIANKVAYDKLTLFRQKRELAAAKAKEESEKATLTLVPDGTTPEQSIQNS